MIKKSPRTSREDFFLKERLLRRWENVNEHALLEFSGKGFDFAFFEFSYTVDKREEGIISTTLDIFAGMKLGATLTHYDIAFIDFLSAKDFYAKTLGNGVASETG